VVLDLHCAAAAWAHDFNIERTLAAILRDASLVRCTSAPDR
jgi:hypothetical protein